MCVRLEGREEAGGGGGGDRKTNVLYKGVSEHINTAWFKEYMRALELPIKW